MSHTDSNIDFSLQKPSAISSPMLPLAATWYITRECQFRCRDCYSVKPGLDILRDQLDSQTAEGLIDELVSEGVYLLKFAGGEPTIRDDFFSLSAHARKSGLSVQVSTNGVWLSENGAEEFLKAGFKAIQISVDSLDEEKSDVFRGKGSFQHAMNAIDACKRSGLKIILALAIRDNNIQDLNGIASFVSQHGIAATKLQPILGAINWKENKATVLQAYNQMNKALNVQLSSLELLAGDQYCASSHTPPPELIILANGSLTKSHLIQNETRYCVPDLGLTSAWSALCADAGMKTYDREYLRGD